MGLAAADPPGACVSWKLIIYVPAGVTAATLAADWLLRPIELWRIALTAAVSLVACILLSALLRTGPRKKSSAPLN
jgi:hypothetical protein